MDRGDITVPVVLEFGREDGFIPRAHAGWLIAHMPGATVILDSGHRASDGQAEYDMAWLASTAA